jgi:hypothetical protein
MIVPTLRELGSSEATSVDESRVYHRCLELISLKPKMLKQPRDISVKDKS